MTAARSAKTSGWSQSAAGHDGDVRPVGVEVAGVLVGLDDERAPPPDPGRGRRSAGQLGRQERPDECRRILAGRDERVDEPAGRRALAVRPGHADQGPPDRRVGDDLLPRLERDPRRPRGDELRVVGIDRGQRLGHREAVRPRGVRHVARGVRARDVDPQRLERGRVGRRTARIAAGDDGARTGSQDRRGARPGAGRADDVDPLALPDRPGRTGRCEAGPDPVRG